MYFQFKYCKDFLGDPNSETNGFEIVNISGKMWLQDSFNTGDLSQQIYLLVLKKDLGR